jgi:predicted XRE-type DNA-binding protein
MRLRASLLPEEDAKDQQTGSGFGHQALPQLAKGVGTMSKRRHASVWDAIEDTPSEVANMKLRSELMIALKNHIAGTQMSQARAAKLFGVTQPRVSDLMRGKINLFGLDALVNMASAAGLHVEMRVRKAA